MDVTLQPFSPAATSGSFSAGVWTSVDVTSYVTGNGVFNLAFSTSSDTNISFSSREGANAPQLVIQTSSGPTVTPSLTSTPGPSLTPTRTPTPILAGQSHRPGPIYYPAVGATFVSNLLIV